MSTQFTFESLFSGKPTSPPLSGEQLRDSGIDAAFDRAQKMKSEYIERCLEAIEGFPVGALLTSEDVREIAGEPDRDLDRSVMAGILKNAQKKKLIVITNQTTLAKRASVHAKRIAKWQRI